MLPICGLLIPVDNPRAEPSLDLRLDALCKHGFCHRIFRVGVRVHVWINLEFANCGRGSII